MAKLPDYETAKEVVANAISDAEVVAGSVTPSNDEGGVVEWLAKNVLRVLLIYWVHWIK